MIFGQARLAEARGAILAHTHRLPGRTIPRGTVLDEALLSALCEAGLDEVTVARPEAGEIAADTVAGRLAALLAAPLIARGRAADGRVELRAEATGLLRVNAAALERMNAVDEAVAVVTLGDGEMVTSRERIAAVSVLPFAVPSSTVAVVEALARRGPLLSLYPFRALHVAPVVTGPPYTEAEGMMAAAVAEAERLGGTLLPQLQCPHNTAAVARRIREAVGHGAELVLIAGTLPPADRHDVAPAAIVAAGGAIERLGMPAGPGGGLCLGHVGPVPVVVLPPDAAAAGHTGLARLLERIFTGVPVTSGDIARMGVGGLEREKDARAGRTASGNGTSPAPPPTVAAIVLAAGRSRRMAPLNKLLVEDAGAPMIARVVDHVLASQARPVIVVLGHQAREVEAALAGRKVLFVEAPDYADGLSASLKSGIAALPPGAQAAMICLGDMPLVSTAMMDRLIAAFDPVKGHTIIKPTYRGKQGNPMIWGRQYFDEILALTGDVGARHLAARHADAVAEVEMADDGVLRDFDTVDTLAGLRSQGQRAGGKG